MWPTAARIALTSYRWIALNQENTTNKEKTHPSRMRHTKKNRPILNPHLRKVGLISQYDPDSAEAAYHHYDALGSTRQLTDSSRSVVNTYIYDAWGQAVSVSETVSNFFRWIGERGYYFDDDVDGYYVRARHYDTPIGRWMSQDPVFFPFNTKFTGTPYYAEVGREWNLYEYTGANPIKHSDPSGNYWQHVVGGGCCAGCMTWTALVADEVIRICRQQRGPFRQCVTDGMVGAFNGMGGINRSLVGAECGVCAGYAARGASKFPQWFIDRFGIEAWEGIKQAWIRISGGG